MNNLDVVVGAMPRGFGKYLGAGTDLAPRIDIWFPGARDAAPTAAASRQSRV